jgi:hypothetical protein
MQVHPPILEGLLFMPNLSGLSAQTLNGRYAQFCRTPCTFCGVVFSSFSSSSYTPKEGTQEYIESKILLEKIFGKYEIDGKIIFEYEFSIYIGRI